MTRRRLVARSAFLALALLTLGGAASAHQGQEHIMGTVKAVDERSITVATKGNKEVAVQLDPSTRFDKEGSAATVKDIAAGDRVVVHAKKGDAGLTAVLVKVGASGSHEHHPHGAK